jgi:hypothetical protein
VSENTRGILVGIIYIWILDSPFSNSDFVYDSLFRITHYFGFLLLSQSSFLPAPLQSSFLPAPLQSSFLPAPLQSSFLPAPLQSSFLPAPLQSSFLPLYRKICEFANSHLWKMEQVHDHQVSPLLCLLCPSFMLVEKSLMV